MKIQKKLKRPSEEERVGITRVLPNCKTAQGDALDEACNPITTFSSAGAEIMARAEEKQLFGTDAARAVLKTNAAATSRLEHRNEHRIPEIHKYLTFIYIHT
ncbi:hypothetical protein NDU88_006127 [Pleurodeles waltl]|uniref:Uncharacterized protein n=1 Tax=Pleurodeles waltl TaxID=8319 RepID=A0AAV7WZ47_PLEWA|nr:hypothetical protein NDU88_006127 [Pleurodeles waltl]